MNDEHTSQNVKFESNPFTVIIESTKDLFTKVTTLTIIAISLPFIVSLVNLMAQVAVSLVPGTESNEISEGTWLGFFVVLIVLLLQMVLQIVITAFAFMTGTVSVRSETTDFKAGMKLVLARIWRYIGVNILIFLHVLPWIVGVIAIIGTTILLSVRIDNSVGLFAPLAVVLSGLMIFGIYRVYLRYALAPIAIFDHDTTIGAAMKESKHLTRNRLIEIFGITSIATIVPILSFVMVPGALARTYVQRKALTEPIAQKPHILNYLMLFIAGGVVLFIGFLIALIVVLARQ